MSLDSRAKIVLYNPRAVFFTLPLALLAIGSHLDPSRFRFVLVDGRLESDPIGRLLAELEGAAALGVTVLTGDPIRDALGATRAAKQRYPDLPIIWGGWHPSLFPTECLEEPAIDVCVSGQGEETFGEIVHRIDERESLEGISGTASRSSDGTPVRHAPRPFAALDRFRFVDFSAIPLERYFELKGKRQLDYMSSQGCHFRCAFCADPFVYGRQWDGLSPARVGEDLERVHRRVPFDDCHFQDETFFTNSNRVAAIAEEILRRDLRISWAATMRADQGARLPEEIFALARKSGLRKVIIGLESGDPETLLWLKKDTTLDQVFTSAELCVRHGVRADFPTIVGFPGESSRSIAETMRVAKRLQSMNPEFRIPIFFYKPYPGTPITDAVLANGFQIPASLDEWARFDFVGGAGPWVDEKTFRTIERFKFYLDRAWSWQGVFARPARAVLQWRLSNDTYAFPIEKWISELVAPPERLS